MRVIRVRCSKIECVLVYLSGKCGVPKSKIAVPKSKIAVPNSGKYWDLG